MIPNYPVLPVLDVVAGVIWRHGRFLAARRVEGKDMGGFWEFPGGKIESGETPEQALFRELAEELGIGVRRAEFWQCVEPGSSAGDRNIRLHFFHVTAFNGEPCPREGQFICWVDPAEASRLDFLPADASVLGQLAGERR